MLGVGKFSCLLYSVQIPHFLIPPDLQTVVPRPSESDLCGCALGFKRSFGKEQLFFSSSLPDRSVAFLPVVSKMCEGKNQNIPWEKYKGSSLIFCAIEFLSFKYNFSSCLFKYSKLIIKCKYNVMISFYFLDSKSIFI